MTVVHFNPPPGWPTPPPGWTPPAGWRPDAGWPAPPDGWELWLPDLDESAVAADSTTAADSPNAPQPDVGTVAESVRDVVETDDRAALVARISELEEEVERSRTRGAGGVIDLDDQRVLQDVGIYRYHHPLEDAAQYRDRLKELEDRIDGIIKTGKPVLAADLFTFDGSLAKGRRMVADLSRLMLRAYNAEADNCVRSLRAGNITTAKKRIEASVTAIEKLGVIMDMRINPEYHTLRIQELELTADYQMKVQEERERAREERERLREQRRAEQELAAEKERLEKEKAHYLIAMESLRASGDNVAADELAQRLDQINSAIEQNDYRIANIRAGYVYVISNVGAFGPNIVKIGMTRRLVPRDRVRELGDASVPFPYDVHALFFSDDAITLEAELHRAFADRRVNFVNARREFFFARPAQVRDLLVEKVGGLLEFTEQPEAVEYLQSRGRWPSP
jgi:regulator of protease activity HflC (stomatin/prohibitin superfamily)